MTDLQKQDIERRLKEVAEHPFTNTYDDRDCVVCGKPKKGHNAASVVEAEPVEGKKKSLFN